MCIFPNCNERNAQRQPLRSFSWVLASSAYGKMRLWNSCGLSSMKRHYFLYVASFPAHYEQRHQVHGHLQRGALLTKVASGMGGESPFMSPIRAQEPLWGRSPRSSCKSPGGSGLMMPFSTLHLQLACVPSLRIPLDPVLLSAPNTLFQNLSLTNQIPWGPCLWSLNPKYCITADLPKYGFH